MCQLCSAASQVDHRIATSTRGVPRVLYPYTRIFLYLHIQMCQYASISLPIIYDTSITFCPCVMGVRIQPTPVPRRVVRGDYLIDMSYPLPPPIPCRVFLHAMGRMCWYSWALGCPGPGNILFLRRMSSYL